MNDVTELQVLRNRKLALKNSLLHEGEQIIKHEEIRDALVEDLHSVNEQIDELERRCRKSSV